MPIRNGVNSERKEFAPVGANSFLSELIPTEKGDENENGRVASPESLHLHLNAINEDQYQMLHPAGSDLGLH